MNEGSETSPDVRKLRTWCELALVCMGVKVRNRQPCAIVQPYSMLFDGFVGKILNPDISTITIAILQIFQVS